jgi:hypothetical protein
MKANSGAVVQAMPELARPRTQLTDTYTNNCGGGASGHLCPPPCWLIAFLGVSLGKGGCTNVMPVLGTEKEHTSLLAICKSTQKLE